MGEPAIQPDQRREARRALVAVTQDDTAAAREHAERLLALTAAAPGNGTTMPGLVLSYRFATSILGLLDALAG
jgi:hypothetical protein